MSRLTRTPPAGTAGDGADNADCAPRPPLSRRRILKGAALSAPAIFTLPSNAAAIAFGSFAQCVRNTEPRATQLHVDSSDGVARREVAGIYVKMDGEESQPWTGTGNDHVLVDYLGGVYVDEQNRPWTKILGAYFDPDGIKYFDSGTTGRRYTVAFVNDDGEILGIHPDNIEHGKAISGSCWASIA